MIQIPNPDTGVPDIFDWQDIILFIIINVTIFGSAIWYFWRQYRRNATSTNQLKQWFAKRNVVPSSNTIEGKYQPVFPMKDFTPEVVGEITLDGTSIVVGFGWMRLGEAQENIHPLVYFQQQLSAEVSGRALIKTSNARWAGQLDLTKLESTMFKGFLSVWSNPKKLSTLIMSPDFMDWYERQKLRPVIYVEGANVCIAYQESFTAKTLDELATALPMIVRYIERSGALEKIAN